MKFTQILVWLGGSAVLAGVGAWLALRPIEVTAVNPTRGSAVEIVYGTGSVEPLHWAKVASLIRERIVEICDCEGRMIARGDVLAGLDDREAKAQLRDLQAREEFAQREYRRQADLIGREVTTRQALDRALMDLRQIQAQISAQRERVADYTVLSPMDGIVLRRDGEIGEIAEAGQILFRVGAPKPLQVVAEVNEEDIPRVAVGQSVLFRTDAFPDARLAGQVREITPMGDSIAKTYRVRIALPDDTPLMIGMSVEANIVTREKADTLLVPTHAVHEGAVFILDNGYATRRVVSLGIRGSRMTEVTAGVGEADHVLIPGTKMLTDRQAVRVRRRSM